LGHLATSEDKLYVSLRRYRQISIERTLAMRLAPPMSQRHVRFPGTKLTWSSTPEMGITAATMQTLEILALR
jgi:hypothetical protein